MNEFEFSWSKVSNIQPQLEKLISKNYFLNISAKEAYKAYVRAYESHSLKHIYDVHNLCLKSVGNSFGFVVPPHIDVGVAPSKKARPRKRENEKGVLWDNVGCCPACITAFIELCRARVPMNTSCL